MILKFHWLRLMCHNGIPHLVHGAVEVTVREAKREVQGAKRLDHKLTQLYVLPETESDGWVLVQHNRRYMNG